MISTADPPVESGQVYTVTKVDGQPPQSLADFAGDIDLTLTRNGQLFQLIGAAARPTAGSVRFYQKDVAQHDRDIRVWTITEAGAASFLASPFAAF